jgi:hypothetical protein
VVSGKFAHSLLFNQVPDRRVYQLVHNGRHCEDASYNGDQLNEESIPAFILADVQLCHWVGLVSEHHHWDAW